MRREAKSRVQHIIGLRNVGYQPKAEDRYYLLSASHSFYYINTSSINTHYFYEHYSYK
jgi:hypothetical protein